MVDSVIPSSRQNTSLKDEIKAIFNAVPVERFEIRSNTVLGKDINLDNILEQGFDAVFIAIGLPRAITSSDKQLDGLYDALDFLNIAKHSDSIGITDKKVGIIGGGNTAMDAAVTAVQKGAQDVYILYRRSFNEMPAWSAEMDKAINRGVHFLVLTQQLDYISDNGKLKGVKVCPCQLDEVDQSGRRKPVPIKESSYDLEMDIIIEAIGQQSQKDISRILPGIELNNGLIKINEGYQTTVENVFAGGDIVRGASTVVAAVSDGMKAATSINNYLRV
jgi:glutamate synthase (NADPH/NADH) small chain